MSQNNDSSELFWYIPMILTAAFLIGCLTIALVDTRESAASYTERPAVSVSDTEEDTLSQKSPLRENGGLRYRIINGSGVASQEDGTAVEAWADGQSESSVSSETESEGEMESQTPSETGTDGQIESQTPSETGTDVASEIQTSVASEEPLVLNVPNEHYINFVPPKEGRIAYLTFDDGPSSNTMEILNILDYYNVKATFFVIYHKDMEDEYKAIVERGHTIALHTYSHNYAKIYRSENAFFNDLTRISDYVYSVTGVRSRIIRFPGGSSNTVSNHYSRDIMQRLKVSVPQKGYVYHDWNVDSEDAAHNNLAPERIVENVKGSLTKYRKPDILMHDSGGTKRTTVEALPEMIEYIYSQGYKMERLELDSYAVHHDW